MRSERDATEESTGWLTVRRTSGEDIKERELYVSLDGKRLGILKYGDSATVPISPGRHELRVHNTLSRKKAEFDATAAQHVRFKLAGLVSNGKRTRRPTCRPSRSRSVTDAYVATPCRSR
jgi:hypothetical protein